MVAGKRSACPIEAALSLGIAFTQGYLRKLFESDVAVRQLLKLASQSSWIPELSKKVRLNCLRCHMSTAHMSQTSHRPQADIKCPGARITLARSCTHGFLDWGNKAAMHASESHHECVLHAYKHQAGFLGRLGQACLPNHQLQWILTDFLLSAGPTCL